MERGWDDGRARERGEEFLGDESLGGRRCRLATVPLKLCGLSVVDTSYIDSRRRARPCRVRLLLLEWQRFIPRSLSIPSPLFLSIPKPGANVCNASTCAKTERAARRAQRFSFSFKVRIAANYSRYFIFLVFIISSILTVSLLSILFKIL